MLRNQSAALTVPAGRDLTLLADSMVYGLITANPTTSGHNSAFQAGAPVTRLGTV